MTIQNSQFVINQEKADEQRERFLYFFKKTVLRIRDESRNNPIYLIRYSLFTCRWFSVKLHRIMLSDDDCFHTHPWRGFISFILWGGYYEHTPGTSYGGYTAYHLSKKWYYGPLSLLWRPGQFPHKLELKDGKPALTLVVTFKKVREWGFYTRIGKWIHWKEYIRSGAKCE